MYLSHVFFPEIFCLYVDMNLNSSTRRNTCPQHRAQESTQSSSDIRSHGSKVQLLPWPMQVSKLNIPGASCPAAFHSPGMIWQRGTEGIPINKRKLDKKIFSVVFEGNWLCGMVKRDATSLRWFVSQGEKLILCRVP